MVATAVHPSGKGDVLAHIGQVEFATGVRLQHNGYLSMWGGYAQGRDTPAVWFVII